MSQICGTPAYQQMLFLDAFSFHCISYYWTVEIGQSQKDSLSTSHDSAGQSRPSLYSSVSKPLGGCEM